MESKSVRKIDILNILKCVLKKWVVVAIIAVLGAGLLGGYEYFMYKVQEKNQLFVNATQKDLVYGSFIIYINNFDDSENYYNRIEDVQAIIKGHGSLDKVMKEHNIIVNYDIMANCVAAVPVGINMLEISVEGSLIGLTQEQVLAVTESLYEVTTESLYDFFGRGCITVIEEPHTDAYELKAALTVEDEKKITKKTVIKFGLLGGVAGGCFGVIAVIFYVLISTMLRTKNEVLECYGMNLLGDIDKRKADREEYKRAVKKLNGKSVLAFVSATDSENRNEAVDKVAATMAVNGVKAVVVRISGDASDMAKNSLYQYVAGKGDVKSMVENTDNNSVKNVNWNESSSEDIDLFTHKKFAEAVETLKGMFDYVLIDCPAMKTSAAGLNIATVCDGVVVVGSCGLIKERDVEKLKYTLSENDINPLGLLYIE